MPHSKPAGKIAALRLAIALVLFVACDREPGSTAPISVFEDTSIAEWQITASPITVIGAADDRDGYAFERIGGAVLTSSAVMVADRGALEVRSYTLQGRLIERQGGKGGGPGEFHSIAAVRRMSDSTVAVWDPQGFRVTVLDAHQVVNTFRPDVRQLSTLVPKFVGALSSGKVVLADHKDDRQLRDEPPGERRDTLFYFVADSSGADTRLLTRRPGTEVVLVRGDNSWGTSPIIFGRSHLVSTAGTMMVAAATDSFVVEKINEAGATVASARFPRTSRFVRPQDVTAARIAFLDSIRSAYRGRSMGVVDGQPLSEMVIRQGSTAIQNVPNRATFPAISDLRGCDDGSVWIAEYSPPLSTTRTWLLLDSDLRPVARLAVRAEIDILDLNRDLLAARGVDELGLESLQLYAITHTQADSAGISALPRACGMATSGTYSS